MTIRVKSYLTMQAVMDNQVCQEIDYFSMTLHDLLMVLVKKHGREFKSAVFKPSSSIVGPNVRILVNGRHFGTLPDKINTRLEDGDEIGIFPLMAGG